MTTTDDTAPSRYDTTVQVFANQGLRHQVAAGPEISDCADPAWAARRQACAVARNNLATVMIFRHIRTVAPNLIADLIDLTDTANMLSDVGVLVKLSQYLRDAGGSPEWLARELEMLKAKGL